MGRPLTKVPLLLPRSRIRSVDPSNSSMQLRRPTIGDGTTMSHSGPRPITSLSPGISNVWPNCGPPVIRSLAFITASLHMHAVILAEMDCAACESKSARGQLPRRCYTDQGPMAHAVIPPTDPVGTGVQPRLCFAVRIKATTAPAIPEAGAITSRIWRSRPMAAEAGSPRPPNGTNSPPRYIPTAAPAINASVTTRNRSQPFMP